MICIHIDILRLRVPGTGSTAGAPRGQNTTDPAARTMVGRGCAVPNWLQIGEGGRVEVLALSLNFT